MSRRELPPAQVQWRYMVCEDTGERYVPVAAFSDGEDLKFFISASEGIFEGELLPFEWDAELGAWAPLCLRS